MLEELKEIVCRLNKELTKKGLVTMTSGNASGRTEDGTLAAVKPSGVAFEELRPEDILIVDLEGGMVEGKLKPSVDTETHLYIYRHMDDVRGIVHTHSPYATSFAARGEGIPCCLTAMADEFGGPIPISEYAKIGGDEIGKEVVRLGTQCSAILMKNHGVFAIGPSPAAAFKAAVMCEDVAKTMHLAMVHGTPIPIPEEEIARAHMRYKEKYGQD
jgi:L-ribulose-5-phosphate 4-epimerase